MTSPSLVSMIVPTYNQARYLGACLDSIWFQDHPNLEIIVVNDCSTDDTRQVLEDFARQVEEGSEVSYASYYNEAEDVIERVHHPRYPRAGRSLKILHNEKNIGSTPTYNRGFQAAHGRLLHLHRLGRHLPSADGPPPWPRPWTGTRPTSSTPTCLSLTTTAASCGNSNCRTTISRPASRIGICAGVSKLYRRSLHETFGWYNNDFLANDHEFYLRLAMGGARFKHIAKTLYSIRTHDNREVNVHSSSNWGKLLNESKGLALKARAILEGQIGMSVCIITGSGGLIGAQSARFFASKGFDVVGIDNDMRRYFFGDQASTKWQVRELAKRIPGYVHHDADIRDAEAIDKIFAAYGGDVKIVIHAAAQPSHDWAAREPLTDFDINARGTLVMLETVRKHCPEAAFIFTSTNKVYGDTPNRLPLVERETRWELDESHPLARHAASTRA